MRSKSQIGGAYLDYSDSDKTLVQVHNGQTYPTITFEYKDKILNWAIVYKQKEMKKIPKIREIEEEVSVRYPALQHLQGSIAKQDAPKKNLTKTQAI